ncbi:hypothetical protein BZM27_29710 [Paraburkholderia steynii]|uniref:histidine kinase n=1 Tax=Paraburkholderia steynii TaxID=1245441 RepID=A0A4V2NGR8_9BURK|nr:hypothetical protein BZM27_29710 [Paraburkholderia steynii]
MYAGFAANSIRRRLCVSIFGALLMFGLAGMAGSFLVVRGATDRIEAGQNAALQVTKQVSAGEVGKGAARTGRGLDPDELALRGIIPIAAAMMLLSIAAALIVWRCLRPLDQLRSFANSIDPECPSPAPFDDAPVEFRSVIDTINQLATRLVAGREAEKRLTRNAAHVLRTPIAAIRVQAANLSNGPVTQREERLAELQHGVERLASLGNQLVALANADEAVSDDMVAEVALRRVVYDVVAGLFPLAVERGIDLGAGHIDDVKVRAAEPDLRQLLNNVVDNAIRHSGNGAHVTVTVSRMADRAVIEVIDDGPGMAGREIDRAFERFERGEAAGGQGSGLGLAIARALALRYGGSVALEVRSVPATGVSVRIELPALTHRAKPTESSEHRQ